MKQNTILVYVKKEGQTFVEGKLENEGVYFTIIIVCVKLLLIVVDVLLLKGINLIMIVYV